MIAIKRFRLDEPLISTDVCNAAPQTSGNNNLSLDVNGRNILLNNIEEDLEKNVGMTEPISNFDEASKLIVDGLKLPP